MQKNVSSRYSPSFLSRSSVEAGDSQNLEPSARMRKLLCAQGVDSVLARMRSESPLPQIVKARVMQVAAKEAEQ